MADYLSIFEAAGKQHNVDPRLLRAVMTRESDGDPTAVSPKGATGLMQLMPGTAKEMGVTDIKDPVQNIYGGAKYLAQQLEKYKDVPLALAAYNAGPGNVDKAGGIPNFPETQAYVKRTMGAYQGQNMPQSQMPGLPPDASAASSGDPFSKLMASGGAAPKSGAEPAASADDPFSRLMAQGGQQAKASESAASTKPSAGTPPVTLTNVLGAAVEPLLTAGSSIVAFPVATAARVGAAALPGVSFDRAKQIGESAQDALTYHPQTAGGQQANSDIGRVAGNAMSAIANTAPVKAMTDAYQRTFVQGQSPLMATVNDVIPGVTASIVAPVAGKAVFNKAIDAAVNVNRLRAAIPVAESSAATGAEASAKPRFKLHTDGSMEPLPPHGASQQTFTAPEMPAAKSKIPASEQQANIDAMREIGLSSQRQSAFTGDKFAAGQEFQHSKLDSPVGEVMREQLQQEQAAIKNYANSIVKDTGAAAATPEAIGQTVREPLKGLSDHYDNQVRGLYQAADERAGGVAGIEPEGFGKLMNTNSMFAGKAENSSLRRGIRAYMSEQGIVDGEGNIQSITAKQAEGMRQYLNSQWSPQNSVLVGKIKQSLDMDVAKAGGDDIYTAARALHAERMNTLDNPKGIASLLQESGPNGINQMVPDEKIGAKLTSMPTAQFEHVVNTLKNLPDELQVQGQQALAEIKGTLAKKIYEAGDRGGTQNGPSMWNAANVTRELNAQSSKMALVFSPDEMAKFETLNRGGHILQTPSAYPGAAVQGHNLLQRGMIWAPPAAGAALGHAVAGYPGMAVGSTLGGSLSGKIARKIDMSNANKLRAKMANPQPVH